MRQEVYIRESALPPSRLPRLALPRPRAVRTITIDVAGQAAWHDSVRPALAPRPRAPRYAAQRLVRRVARWRRGRRDDDNASRMCGCSQSGSFHWRLRQMGSSRGCTTSTHTTRVMASSSRGSTAPPGAHAKAGSDEFGYRVWTKAYREFVRTAVAY
jgi:hypothetical protein